MSSIVTVVSPADTQDLTDLDTVKDELGITDTSEDDKLSRYIRQASDAIAAYCDRKFGLERVTETFVNVAFRDVLRLKRRPIDQVFSVTQDASNVDLTQYLIDYEKGLLHRVINGFPITWAGTLVIDYTAGYMLLDDLPHAIERACLMLISQYRSSAGRDPYLRSEDIPGVASYSYGLGSAAIIGSSLPPEVTALLDPYRDLTIA